MTESGTRQVPTELPLALDRSSAAPLRVQLECRLRELIQTGVLPADMALPSSRTLAGDLGVSRRLVVEAYEQLTAEGYVRARPRAGTVVASVAGAATASGPDEPPPARFDLRPGIPSLAHFPRTAWVNATAAALRQAPEATLAYPDPRGSRVLRGALADYLRRVRAVAAQPERILVCTGFRQALSLITRVAGAPAVGLEDPGLIGRERTVAAAGGSPVPIAVDAFGLRVDLLAAGAAEMVVVAPAHQFPLGVTLSPGRRASLLDWACGGGLVIEDDYDAEFRYDRQPIGALQGLAPERVAYIGTTSKTLAPGLRLGWAVLPGSLIDAVTEAKHDHDSGSPTIEQLALPHMIGSGAYERHLRRVRRHYRQRRDRLAHVVAQELPDAEITGTAAGLHLMLRLPVTFDGRELVAAARERDLAIAPLERYTLTPSRSGTDQIVIGYGNIATPSIEQAIGRLAGAIAAARD